MSTGGNPATAVSLRLGADRFYWAEIDPTGLTGSGARGARRRRQLGFVFESAIPVPIETVHAVYARLPNGRMLACAMSRDELAGLMRSALAIGPDRLPEFLDHHDSAEPGGVRAESINLLTGRFEPAPVRRSRTRWAFQVAAIMLLCTVMLTIGAERRISRAQLGEAQRANAIEEAFESVLGRAAPETTQPPSARLLAELRMSRQSARAMSQASTPEDASPGLAALLRNWPDGVDVQTDTIQAGADRITLSARLPDNASADRLEQALGGMDGWSIGQRSIRRARDGVELRLPLTRVEEQPR